MRDHVQARLLYDSASVHETTGMRSSLGTDRTLVFRSHGLTVDVMVHAGRRPPGILHGQVVEETVGRPIVGARVELDRSAGCTETDEHGQFAVSTPEPQGENVLRIGAAECPMLCVIPPVSRVAVP